jgi:hypothetical protein
MTMHDSVLSPQAIRLDKLQQNILEKLYIRSERRHTLPELAREVFPGAAAYRDAELMGFVMPRLRRMRSLNFVRLERLGADMSASISLRGIEFMERQVPLS